MEVNKELISYIKASELLKISNPVSGDLIHAQGDNLSTTPMSHFLEKMNMGAIETIVASTVVPVIGSKRYIVVEVKTYTNVSPNITVTQDDLNDNWVYISTNNGVASKELNKKPSVSSSVWFNKQNGWGINSKVQYPDWNGFEYVSPIDHNASTPGADSTKWLPVGG